MKMMEDVGALKIPNLRTQKKKGHLINLHSLDILFRTIFIVFIYFLLF